MAHLPQVPAAPSRSKNLRTDSFRASSVRKLNRKGCNSSRSRILHGFFRETWWKPWKTMENHGKPWKNRGNPPDSPEISRKTWRKTMENHGKPQRGPQRSSVVPGHPADSNLEKGRLPRGKQETWSVQPFIYGRLWENHMDKPELRTSPSRNIHQLLSGMILQAWT